MDIFKLHNTACSIQGSPLPPVKVTYLTEEKIWELVESYQVEVRGFTFSIAAGFRFNLASSPRVIWGIIAPFELSLVAPLVHDFLYDVAGQVPPESVEPDHTFSRREADLIFRDLMVIEEVAAWRRILAFRAVRWFARDRWEGD